MLVVQKYGGSSLASPSHIRRAAERIANLRRSGAGVVVVASAMGHTTDHLLKLAQKTVSHPPAREVDMLLTAGERISMSLLSMALQDLGTPAISFTGSQSGIITTNEHREAKIIDIRPHRIQEELAKGKVVIIAGFQGVSELKEITTLGRGGSDTTAVALASVLNADRCEILTDVDGLFDADPRIVPEAKIIHRVDYETALEMANLGAKMQPRSIEVAEKFQTQVHVESSKGLLEGTRITKRESSLEAPTVSAIATKDQFSLFKIECGLKEWASLIKDSKIALRFLSQTAEGLNILCEKEKINSFKKELELNRISFVETSDLAVVSIVGNGISENLSLQSEALEILKVQEISCESITANSLSISFTVPSKQKATLANSFHEYFLG